MTSAISSRSSGTRKAATTNGSRGPRVEAAHASAFVHRVESRISVRPAGPGDHPSIHQFLLSIFQGPSTAEFCAQQEEPLYEPSDRLIVKSGYHVVSHVRLSKREMHFGDLVLPVSGVSELATAPEYRAQGCASAVLAAADRKMVEDGAVMGMLRTGNPHFYLKRGWTVCPRHCFSTAGPRAILSHLSATEPTESDFLSDHLLDSGILGGPRRRLNIRLWRHVERGALMRLYDENAPGTYGALNRNEAYWRWLINRRGYDRIYVAIDGPNKLELDDEQVPIVGYAAMKEGRIAELMTVPDHPRAARQLLARACGDAIERDYHSVRLDAPPGHPLHQAIVEAGGRFKHHEAENGEVFMVKLFDPLAFLERLLPQLHERAKAADLPRPCELGITLNDEKYRLVVNRRGVKLSPGKLGRSYLGCNRSVLTQLLLGHLKVKDATESGRLETSTQVATEIAGILFPPLPLWRPPLDDLPA